MGANTIYSMSTIQVSGKADLIFLIFHPPGGLLRFKAVCYIGVRSDPEGSVSAPLAGTVGSTPALDYGLPVW